MELKLIQGQPRIAFKQGKREVVQAPAEVMARARKRIEDSRSMLTSLENTRHEQQARLEEALLAGGSTAGARKELATIAELEADQAREIDDAEGDMRQVEFLIDSHRADQLNQDRADSILALCAPFDNFLKEHQK
jgi:hypothetical protein